MVVQQIYQGPFIQQQSDIDRDEGDREYTEE